MVAEEPIRDVQNLTNVELAARLRDRAQMYRFGAIFIIVLVASLLVFAGYLFVFASDIARKDSVGDMARFEQQLNEQKALRDSIALFVPSQKLQSILSRFKGRQDKIIDDINRDLDLNIDTAHSSLFYKNGRGESGRDYYVSSTKNNYGNRFFIDWLEIDLFLDDVPSYVYLHPSVSTGAHPLLVLRDGDRARLDAVKTEIQLRYRSDIMELDNLAQDFKELWGDEYLKFYEKFDKSSNNLQDIEEEIEKTENILLILDGYEKLSKLGVDIEQSVIGSNLAERSTTDAVLLFASTNIIRFGPLVAVVFFSGLLSTLYRYCMRLSAYYDARADALDFISLDVCSDKYSALVSTLSPENYDFAKSSVPSTKDVIKLAHAISRK